MAVIFNKDDVEKEALNEHVHVQRLITPERVNSDSVLTEIWYVGPDTSVDFTIAREDMSWAHILEGQAELRTESSTTEVNQDHFLLLPNGVNSKITSADGAVVFRAIVPIANRFDPGWGETTSNLRCIDWTNEPVLNSEFDARKRIYMLTPKLSGTKVAKGEMIIYPPETMASNHHHEGAEHFQVILKGSATFHLNEQPHKVKAGDTVYIYDYERHFIINDGDEDLIFIEYFVPGVYKTTWATDAPVCTWNPSGSDIKGGIPAREIAAHSSAEAHTRDDL